MRPDELSIYRDLTRWFETHIIIQTGAGLGIVRDISTASGLSFANLAPHPNTCLQASSEVRPEYRLYYTPDDLFHFLLGWCLEEPAGPPARQCIAAGFAGMVVPKGPAAFWDLVDSGVGYCKQEGGGNPNGEKRA